MRLSLLACAVVGLLALPGASPPLATAVYQVSILDAPFVDADGVAWDGMSSTGPDLFVTIQVGSSQRWRSGTYRDARPGSFPLPLDVQPVFVYAGEQPVHIVLWDDDPAGASFIGSSHALPVDDASGVRTHWVEGSNGTSFSVELGAAR